MIRYTVIVEVRGKPQVFRQDTDEDIMSAIGMTRTEAAARFGVLMREVVCVFAERAGWGE